MGEEDLHQAKEGEAHQEEGQTSCAQLLHCRRVRQGDPHASRVCARGLWRCHLHGPALRSSVLWQVPPDIHVQEGRRVNEHCSVQSLVEVLAITCGELSADCLRDAHFTTKMRITQY